MFVSNDYCLTIVGFGKIKCQYSMIIDMYRVLSLSANLLFVPQLTQVGKKVEFWPNPFVVKDTHNDFIVVIGILTNLSIANIAYPFLL